MRAISVGWVLLFFVFAMLPLGAMAAYNYYHDPFTMYRRGDLYYVNGRFQRKVGAGILRTEREAEALVIGNSYTANVDPALVERLFRQKTLVMSQWGVSAGDIHIVTNYALRRIPTLRTVFLSLPIWGVCSRQPHPTSPIPLSLYYGYYWSDIEYLLSMETARAAWNKPSQFSEDMSHVIRWWHINGKDNGNMDIINRLYARQPQPSRRKAPSRHAVEAQSLAAFQCYKDQITALVRAYPKVDFYIFNPPHLQWLLHSRWMQGSIDYQIRAMELIAEFTDTLPTVRFFDFYSAPADRVMHCRHYRDLSHFDLEVSDYLFEAMASGQFERTTDTNSQATARTLKNLETKLDCT